MTVSKILTKTDLPDGHYTVKSGYIVERGDPKNAGTWFARIVVWLFAAWIIVGLASCVVQDGKKIYDTVTEAK